jgi:hypothetical protein
MTESTEDLFLAGARGLAASVVMLGGSTAIYPGGRNGPYFDLESPVRNTAHALSSMAIAYAITREEVFAERGRALANFLVSDHEFSASSTPVHRQKHPKDWCNGVIGPAWVVEGLALAGRLLGVAEASVGAQALVASQPFDERSSLWRRHDPRGGIGSVDRTLNHQAYFATAAAQATEAALSTDVGTFLDHLASGGFRIRETGRIVHHVPRKDEDVRSLRGLRERALRKAADLQAVRRLRGSRAVSMSSSEVRDHGYHIFSLFSLAGLRLRVPSHPFWRSGRLRQALEFAVAPGWLDSLDRNPYTYPYNGPGLELPLVARAFGDLEPQLHTLADAALRRQVELTWDARAGRFCRGTDDRLTLAARTYELGLALPVAFAGAGNVSP